eukprot:CAMPEP_0196132610 /NCGR_PEP_ID=MMETSP0910-20130528/2154_1 /TAXON_ID=49265 /ORGANISM="Thalassiosira rotula, Strain GSO102" /LENGTH=472 /DNA_ID=CAMNT_0041392229 /DNA_START=69 /DNA_END=1490 /DNA_ORIENTATION=+
MMYYSASILSCPIALLSYQLYHHFFAPSTLLVAAFSYSPSPLPSLFAKTSAASSQLRQCCCCQSRQQQYPHRRNVGFDLDPRVGGVVALMSRVDVAGDTSVPVVDDDVSRSSSDGASSDVVSESRQSEYIWDVYIGESSKKEKGTNLLPTSSSLIQAFISLTPASSDDVRVHPAVFHNKQNKQKGKGHTVRCIQRKRTGDDDDGEGKMVAALEIGNVDSVDKVYRIMTEHMKLGEINPKACECMRHYFEGNQKLSEGEPSSAITHYNQALSLAEQQHQHSPSSSSSSQQQHSLPKGSILMKRARAYLQRASNHRHTLRTLVTDLADTVPSASTMKILYQTASAHPPISIPIFHRLATDSKIAQSKFRQIRYRHDMYEFALLHAVQDSLRSTQISPDNAYAYVLAGECLAELRKLKESNEYYRRALEIDPDIMELYEMEGLMEKNRVSEEFMEVARASGFSGDTLRLALDVAV